MSDIPGAYEVLEVGDTYELPDTYEVTEDDVVAFGERWDPQPFHTDPEAAAESMYDGLVASGFQVCAIANLLVVEQFLIESGAIGGVGIDDLRWQRPVRPGDVLQATVEIEDKKPWFGDQGLVRLRVTLDNEDDRVMSLVGLLRWETEDDD